MSARAELIGSHEVIDLSARRRAHLAKCAIARIVTSTPVGKCLYGKFVLSIILLAVDDLAAKDLHDGAMRYLAGKMLRLHAQLLGIEPEAIWRILETARLIERCAERAKAEEGLHRAMEADQRVGDRERRGLPDQQERAAEPDEVHGVGAGAVDGLESLASGNRRERRGGKEVVRGVRKTTRKKRQSKRRGDAKLMRSMTLTLPWPPSVNKYWRHTRDGRNLISRDGRDYRIAVRHITTEAVLRRQGFGESRLSVSIIANPPDGRKRDIDNLLKCPLDALQKAGIYADDGQIDRLMIMRGAKVDGGRLVITIEEIAS